MGLKQGLHFPCLPLGLLVTSASEMINFSLKGSYHSFLIDCPLLGKIEGRRRRGQPRTRWLDDTTDSVDMTLSKLRETVNDKEASRAAVRGIAQLDSTGRLKATKTSQPSSQPGWARIYPRWSSIFPSSRPHTLPSNPPHPCGVDTPDHRRPSRLLLLAAALS